MEVPFFPDLTIGYVPQSRAATKNDRKVKDRYIESHFEERRSTTTRVYRFVAKKALYLINLEMSINIPVRYSLSLNIKSVIALPPNNEILGYLPEGNADIYEIKVKESSNLLIRFLECFGNSEISAAMSRAQYKNDEFQDVKDL